MEGDAGTRQLNPTDADETPDQSVAVSPDDITEIPSEDTPEPDAVEESTDDGRRPSRLGRGWLVGICTALVLLTAGAGVGGYLAWQSHEKSSALAVDETRALQAAKECIAATQAPDTTTMTTGQAKIIECSTGDFGAQAALYSGMLVDAYRAANVQVQVSDMRTAVEKHNDDGSIDVLVAVRVKVTNSEAADQEQGYRLRVQMAPADGTYKIAKLDQVTS
jgi:Mce-associated membrane protein